MTPKAKDIERDARMSVEIRAIDHRVMAIVAQAMRERYVIRPCENLVSRGATRAVCGGPEIFSKLRPEARCFACGRFRSLEAVASAARRWRCDRCRRFFHAVLGTAWCPACRAGQARQTARVRRRMLNRERSQRVKMSKTAIVEA